MAALTLDAGAFRLRFTLQRRPATPDDFGGLSGGWTGDEIIWAAPMTRRAVPTPGEAGPDIADNLRIIVRSGHAMAPGMRLVGEQANWRVVTVADPDLTGRYLTCDLVAEETEEAP